MFPEIILNCAASADGKIALPDRKKITLSNKEDYDRVHRLRSECDAILVGIGTVIEDNPKLTTRNGKGCLLYTSPSPRDVEESRMPSSA